MGDKYLANVPSRRVEGVAKAVYYALDREDDIVLIGESGSKVTEKDRYAYLDTETEKVKRDDLKSCYMLFDA